MNTDSMGAMDYYGPGFDPMGFPTDPQSGIIPSGFEKAVANDSQAAPQISTIDKIWGAIKQDSQSALQWTEDEVKGAYSTTKNAVGTVVSDVTAPITSSIQSVYWYAIIGVIVLAGAIYFIGKGGAVKVHAVV